MLRGGEDRLWSMTLMMIAITCITAPAMLWLPWPDPSSWPFALTSALIHVVYNLSLVRAYQHSDLGRAYPIARGSSPLIVAFGAAVFSRENIGLLSIVGIGLVSIGILSLAFETQQKDNDFFIAAFVTGGLIGAFTVVDGIGVRLSGNSFSYATWMFFLWSLSMPVLFLITRGKPPVYTRAQTTVGLIGGVVSLLAYGIIIWAMQYTAMGIVSALRETSVLYAALIGRIFLKEKLTMHRVLSCLAVAGGAACLAR